VAVAPWKRALILMSSWCFLVSAVFATSATASAGASPRLDRLHIVQAQRTLEALALDPGPADGVIGPRTKAALIRFQQAEALNPTGTLDTETRSKLAARKRERVREVQKALKASGYDPGPDDGVMGQRTRTAMRRYAAAPAPSASTPSSQLIDRFRRVFEPRLQQSP